MNAKLVTVSKRDASHATQIGAFAMKLPRAILVDLRKSAFSGAAIGASVGLAFWLFALGDEPLKIGSFTLSGDWFKSLGLPIPPWALTIPVGAVFGAAVGIVAEIRRRGRTQLLSETAAGLGMSYASAPNAEARTSIAVLFGPLAKASHHFSGIYSNTPVDLFDIEQTASVEHDDGNVVQSTTARTVCILPAENLPEFTLGPRSTIHRAASHFVASGMSFDADRLPVLADRKAAGAFAKNWIVTAEPHFTPGAETSADPNEREQRVREFITTTLMRSLAVFRECSIRVRAGRLIVWQGNGTKSAEERESLAKSATQIQALFVGALQSRSGAVVPARPGDMVQAHSDRAFGAMVGATAGGFAGAFSGFWLFAVFLMDRVRDESFPLAAGLFFGSAIGGLAVGVVAGACLGKYLSRYLRPAPPFYAPSNSAFDWITLGMFGGAVCGGVLIAALLFADNLLGEPDLPFEIVVPLFFALPIIGMVVGAVVGRRIKIRRNTPK